MRKRTVKLWRLHDDGRKLYAGTIEAADPRELVIKWSAFLGDHPAHCPSTHHPRKHRGQAGNQQAQHCDLRLTLVTS